MQIYRAMMGMNQVVALTNKDSRLIIDCLKTKINLTNN
jgi:hypothetical protein